MAPVDQLSGRWPYYAGSQYRGKYLTGDIAD